MIQGNGSGQNTIHCADYLSPNGGRSGLPPMPIVDSVDITTIEISDSDLSEYLLDMDVLDSELGFLENDIVSESDIERNHLHGLLKEERISSVPGIDGTVEDADTLSRQRRYYYDYRGKVIQVKEVDSDGWASSYSTKYNFAGDVIGTLESHTSPLGMTNTLKTVRNLDPRGVLLGETVYADSVLVSHTDYGYDELMRPSGRTTGAVEEDIEYDIRGWQVSHTVRRGMDAVYGETLRYMNPCGNGAVPRWAGLISESETQHYGNAVRRDSFTYDALGRLSSSNREKDITYDRNGNISSLTRQSLSGVTTSELLLTYSGNRLQRVTDTGRENPGTFAYAYDSSGNLTTDTRNRLEIRNNVLNLPMRMEGKIGYIYLGDGTKVAAKLDSTLSVSSYGEEGLCGMRYRGSFVYDVTVNGIQRLQSISVSTGRLVALTGTNGSLNFEHDGFVTDHLGNVAAVVNLSASPGTSTQNLILEQNDYTPFGTRIEPATKTQAANRWRYAGKEEQRIAGMDLHLIDFGARFYDPFTCRWNATDPLAHKYFSMSPYNYCGNDPVNFFDPDGKTDYLFDEYGNFTKQENDDPYDRIYMSNGNSMIVKDKAILTNLSEKKYISQTDDSEIERTLVYLKTNADISLVAQVFGFIQNNSSVEWGLFQGKSGYNMLGTTKDGSQVRERALFFYSDADKGKTICPIESKIHGHPKEGTDREIPSMEADICNCKITPDIHSYVYFPMSGNIYLVSGNEAHRVSNYKGWKVE